MTSEGIGAVVEAGATGEDEVLHCYRHPDRETRIMCGRCERPICLRCAMQGPVGFRCKTCGTLANDPLSTIRPTQAVLGLSIAIVLGIGAGFISARIGFLVIFLGFFAGGLIAEAVMRVIGIKRGRGILALVLGGIVVGSLVGFGLDFWYTWSAYGGLALPAEEAAAYLPTQFFLDQFIWAAIAAGAACAGAYSRLR
jgi:hypothetical protein